MTDLYIPKDSRSLATLTDIPQIRLGLQSPPGEGKTFAACTFPNVVVLNFDKGLGAHYGRSDVIEIPFTDPQFVDSLAKRNGEKDSPPNKRDALTKWLKTEGMKLQPRQTLVFDSGSAIEDAFHTQQRLEPVTTRTGEINTMAFWGLKLDYYSDLFDTIFNLKCNIVWCSHEQAERNKQGDLSGKNRPLMSGQFADKIVGKFTDWFRQHAQDKPKDGVEPKPETLKQFGMTTAEFMQWCRTFPRNTVYYWQTESDDLFNAKASSLVNFPKFIPATYESFEKYRRKPISA